MPKGTINKTITRRTRKSVRSRKKQAGPRRKGSDGATQNLAPVIANSFLALKLDAKPGLAVVEGQQEIKRRNRDQDDFTAMYYDLLAACQVAVKILHNETTIADPLASGLSLAHSLYYVLKMFNDFVLPKGYSYNIDYSEHQKHYYFTIYKECEMQNFWHAFEIAPVVKKIKRSQKLHDIFLQVIKEFMERCDVTGWWDLGHAFTDDVMDEEIAMWWENHEETKEEWARFRQAKKDREAYISGDPHVYQLLLNSTATKTPEALTEELKTFKTTPLITWLRKMCELMQKPGCINDFIYYEWEGEGQEGLRLDQQVNVIWKLQDDFYTDTISDYIDAEANGCGVIPPIINLKISKYTKGIPLKLMEDLCMWPRQLTHLYHELNQVIEKLNKKRK